MHDHEFDFLYLDPDDLTASQDLTAFKKILPKQMPELPFGDPLNWEKPKGNHAVKLMKDAFCDDIIGDTPTPESCYPRGHPAIQELEKMLQPTPNPTDVQLQVLAKTGRPGWFAYKEIEKAGSIPEGLKNATELFSDRATAEQLRLLQKAIAALDIGAWLSSFTEVFARA